ncbi:hypothetical protein [Microbispora sp. NPDC049125]|uniref:hypothetical protein n=1 Tax=Microbispora sp. NPDC049125 TaxID=3154929 RepID=UPI003467D26E
MIRLLVVHRGVAALLATLALGATLLVSGLPRMMESALDAGIRDAVDRSPAQTTALGIFATRRYDLTPLRTVDEVARRDAEWRALLPPALRAVTLSGGFYDFATSPMAMGDRHHQFLTLQWVSGMDRRIRYVEGAAPGPSTGGRLEVALPAATAAELSIANGDTLRVESGTVTVTGLFEPVRPADRFWSIDTEFTHVVRRRPPLAQEDDLIITGLAHGDSLAGAPLPLVYRWFITPDSGRLTARNAEAALSGVGEFGRRLSNQDLQLSLSTRLDRVIGEYAGTLATTRALMAVVLGGLAVVCLGTMALAVLLLAERMGPGLLLMRARGGSLPSIALVGGGVAALATVPAVAAGYALSALVPGPATLVVHLGPPVLAGVVVAVGAAHVARRHRRPLGETREDLVAARTSPRRVAGEVLVVVLGVGGVLTLRARGLGSGDPFLVLVPALLAVAAALVVRRLYALPLRLAVRLAARGRGAVPYLGLTMSARAATGAALPVLTLLPALAIAAYGAATVGALGTAQRETAWREVGAEIRVEREAGIPADLVERVRRAPGVRGVVTASVGQTVAEVGFGGRPATVVAVDLDAYRRLVQGGPLTIPRAPGTGALVSHDLSAMRGFEIGWPERMTVVPAGVVGAMPAVDLRDRALIVIPAQPAHTNTLLVGADASAVRAVRAVLPPDARVTTVRDRAAELARAPLASAVDGVLRAVTAALAVYALVAVAIALVGGAPARGRALGPLRSLGLTTRQARLLTMIEVAPALLLTTLAGLALGLAMPALLGRGIDLSAYAGAGAVSHAPGPAVPAALAAGIAAVALAGAYLGGIGGSRGQSG